MLHCHADLLNVSRLEVVFVGSRVKTLSLEACSQDVCQLPPFVVRVRYNPLKHALAPINFSIFHGIAAQLDKEVINGCLVRRLFHMLDEVNLEDVDK